MLFARWATAQNAAKLTLLDVTTAVNSCPAVFLMPGCDTQITIATADVAMAEAADMAGRERVDGVMHAAGVLRDALLLKQTSASFREVLSGKASRPFIMSAGTLLFQASTKLIDSAWLSTFQLTVDFSFFLNISCSSNVQQIQ